jgi:lysophospholipase L1-like esterase
VLIYLCISRGKKYEAQHNPGNQEYGVLTTDGVHLNDKGNQPVAEEMMKVLPL